AEKLKASDDDKAFYEAKLSTARYYMDRYLPDAGALRRKLEAGSDSLMALGEEAFATAA
ncbi:MAG: acyl-CoA dehydrogenase C-terminal domain-containing protein, partial [Erythrobacter sp.]|nr:acyl-CoA dehydrogenase C-terminal domain-containing protein [Erythrobacter sp.]